MDCCICLQQAISPHIVACCSNSFCRECLQNWILIKNICPLCGTAISDKSNSVEKEDIEDHNGFIHLEHQLATINFKLSYAYQRLDAWQAQSKNLKSSISLNQLNLIKDQISLAEEYQQILVISIQNLDKETSGIYSQLLTQLFVGIEAALQRKHIKNSNLINNINWQYQEKQQSDGDEFPHYTYQKVNKKDKQRKSKKDIKSKKIMVEEQEV